MKSRIVNNYRYEGLGFPIELENVEMLDINGNWIPKIDVRHIADEVIKLIAVQENRFTGNQVKFIRTHFTISLCEFGEQVIHTSLSAIRKWEKAGNELTNMSINTEQILRLFILEKIQANSKKEQAKFYRNFQRNKAFYKSKNTKPEPIHIDLCASTQENK